MKRYDIINSLIRKNNYETYLEVGVRDNVCFDKIKIKDKSGVDPNNKIKFKRIVDGEVKWVEYISEVKYKMTSDEYFQKYNHKYDIIFLDGLHENEQVYKDIKNALKVLNPGGTILMHDCLPEKEENQAVPPKVPYWNGDVWKAFVRTRSERTDVEMCVVDTDTGVGLITKKKLKEVAIKGELTLNWQNFVKNKEKWMNIIQPNDFVSIVGEENFKQKIRIYALSWNEEVIAPYFLKHYKTITDDIVVYDNCSDDKTCDILKGCEIRKFDTGGKFTDSKHIEIKNEIWKECRGKFDWVFILDMDEIIYSNNLRGALLAATKNGCSVIKTQGYSMVGNKIPTTSLQIYDEINFGKYDDNYSKITIINPDLVEETNYSVGCHTADVKTKCKTWYTNDIKLLHYNYLSKDYAINRYSTYKNRMSDENIINKWGYHYQFKKTEIEKEYNSFKDEAFRVVKRPLQRDKITFVLTSCGRFEELENTLKSFFKYNTAEIDRYVVIEDSGDDKMKQKCIELKNKYFNQIEFIFNNKRIGQILSIDKLYSTIDTEYVFHCEDDWEFYKEGFIEKSMDILKSDNKIVSVWLRELNDTNGHIVDEELYDVGDILYRKLNTHWREGWGGFSFNPGLRRLKEYMMLKPYSKIRQQFWGPQKFYTPELEISMEYAKRGYSAAIMLEGSVRHTGWNKQVK